jgi:hypothetical protein
MPAASRMEEAPEGAEAPRSRTGVRYVAAGLGGGQAVQHRQNLGRLGVVQFLEDRQRLPPGILGLCRVADGLLDRAQVDERP